MQIKYFQFTDENKHGHINNHYADNDFQVVNLSFEIRKSDFYIDHIVHFYQVICIIYDFTLLITHYHTHTRC